MKYVFSIDGPYAYLNHLLFADTGVIEFSVFSDIMFNYAQLCIRRWYYSYTYEEQLDKVRVGLSMYLNPYTIDEYMLYLDTIFWPRINGCITEDINDRTVVIVTIRSDRSLMIELKFDPIVELTKMQQTLNRICAEIGERIYAGEHVNPTLMEIYNVHIESLNISN